MAGVDILAQAFSGANAAFLSEQYARWVVNPNSVDPSFADLFSAMDDDARAVLADAAGASWAPNEISNGRVSTNGQASTDGLVLKGAGAGTAETAVLTNDQVRKAIIDSIRALMLIRSHRVRGHPE